MNPANLVPFEVQTFTGAQIATAAAAAGLDLSSCVKLGAELAKVQAASFRPFGEARGMAMETHARGT